MARWPQLCCADLPIIQTHARACPGPTAACCAEQRTCPGCERLICPEHDDDAVRCEINDWMCRECHEATCTSRSCGDEDLYDPTDL